MPKRSSPPRRPPASGPETARQRELNTKRRGELSELAFPQSRQPRLRSRQALRRQRTFRLHPHQPRLARRRQALARPGKVHRHGDRRLLPRKRPPPHRGPRHRLQAHRGRLPGRPHHPRRLLVHLPHPSPGPVHEPLIPPQKLPQKRNLRPIPRSLAPTPTTKLAAMLVSGRAPREPALFCRSSERSRGGSRRVQAEQRSAGLCRCDDEPNHPNLALRPDLVWKSQHSAIFTPYNLRRHAVFGGCFQWVLGTVCETVEWLSQPLGFESLALRGHSMKCKYA
jgi:hypothetical protein